MGKQGTSTYSFPMGARWLNLPVGSGTASGYCAGSVFFGGILNLVHAFFGDCIRSFDNCVDGGFSSHMDCLSLFLANEIVISALGGFPLNKNLLIVYGGICTNHS